MSCLWLDFRVESASVFMSPKPLTLMNLNLGKHSTQKHKMMKCTLTLKLRQIGFVFILFSRESRNISTFLSRTSETESDPSPHHAGIPSDVDYIFNVKASTQCHGIRSILFTASPMSMTIVKTSSKEATCWSFGNVTELIAEAFESEARQKSIRSRFKHFIHPGTSTHWCWQWVLLGEMSVSYAK